MAAGLLDYGERRLLERCLGERSVGIESAIASALQEISRLEEDNAELQEENARLLLQNAMLRRLFADLCIDSPALALAKAEGAREEREQCS